MENSKKRWLILTLACVINLSIGAVYAWSVFANPMAAYLSEVNGYEIESLAIIFTIANSVGPITMITGGMMSEKIGPRGVIRIGGALFAAGMFFSGCIKSVPMLMLTYGLGVGFGGAMVYGCTISTCVKWFPDKKGFAGGITTAAYGISSVLIPVIANLLIEHTGITTTFKLFGIAIFVIVGICSIPLEGCPDTFMPVGMQVKQDENPSVILDKTWKEMIQDKKFYVMLAILCCGAFSGLMITSQAAIIAQNRIGMTVTTAGLVVSLLALFNTFGRICAGVLSDKIGAIKTLILVFLLLMIGQFCLFLSSPGKALIFCFGILLVGFCFGSTMGIYPGFTASVFGSKNNGVNYGIMFIGFALARFLGPSIMASIYSSTNSYSFAFLIAIGLSAFGLVLSYVFPKLR